MPAVSAANNIPPSTKTATPIANNNGSSTEGAITSFEIPNGVSVAQLLPDYPRNDSLCTDFSTVFANDTKEPGRYQKTLTLSGGNGAIFSISLEDHNLVGRLAYNGIFGYLAFGYAGPNKVTTPMLGSRIIMAMRGGSYTEDRGLDLESDEPVVQEFLVNDTLRDFVHWQTPYMYKRKYTGDINVSTTENGCYTVLTFDIHYIAGQHFNESGVDTFVWAANSIDSYMFHHGPNRGTFTINWETFSNMVESRKSTPQQSVATASRLSVGAAILLVCALTLVI
jgi:hypothetical protein